jgi:hypothetical protein
VLLVVMLMRFMMMIALLMVVLLPKFHFVQVRFNVEASEPQNKAPSLHFEQRRALNGEKAEAADAQRWNCASLTDHVGAAACARFEQRCAGAP